MKAEGTVPEPGDQVERWGNALSAGLGRMVLRWWGWTIHPGPPNLSKYVAVVAPHTSNMDFFVGMAAILAMRMRAYWVAKHTLFRPAPWGRFLKSLGGLPVNRSAPQGIVEQIVGLFERRDRLVLGVTPEGTRKRNAHWKTGFHRIARAAQVPIVLVSFDYATKTLAFGRLLHPSDDVEKDMAMIREFFRGVTPRHPHLFALPERGARPDVTPVSEVSSP